MNNQLETIERYLSQTMDEEERSRFEQRLQEDPALASEVENTQRFLAELKAYPQRKELKSKLEQFHESLSEGKEKPLETNKVVQMRFGYPTWLMAASVALLVGLGILTFLQLSTTSEKAQFQELRTDLERIQQTQKRMWRALKDEEKSFGSQAFGGTAFVISSYGYLVTSYHVVKDASHIFIQNDKYKRLKVSCVYSDKALDVAILKVNDPGFKTFGKIPYGFGSSSKKLGNEVYTLGFPKEDIVYGEGYISSLSGYEGDTTSYQMAIPLNPGNSGGPILDGQGNIIGMIKGKHKEEEGAAFALKTSYLKRFIRKVDQGKIKLPKGGLLPGKSKANQITKVQPFVFQVQVYE